MKVVFTDAAVEDLRSIEAYLAANYPSAAPIVERRLQAVIARIARWPESAQRVIERPGVRVVPLVRYPYKSFYRITEDAVEILHIHHTSRQTPIEPRSSTRCHPYSFFAKAIGSRRRALYTPMRCVSHLMRRERSRTLLLKTPG